MDIRVNLIITEAINRFYLFIFNYFCYKISLVLLKNKFIDLVVSTNSLYSILTSNMEGVKINFFVRKFIGFSIGTWVSFILTAISLPIATRIFHPSEYAILSMFLLSMSFLGLFSMLGTDQSYVLLFHDEKDDSKKSLLYNCLKISLSLAFIVSLLLFFFKERISIYLFGKVHNTLIYMMIGSMYAFILNNLLVRTIQMRQYSKVYSFLTIVVKVTELFIILFAMYALSNNINILSDNSYYLVLSKVVGTGFAIIFAIYFLINHFNTGHSLAENSIRKILTYSFPLLLTMIAFLSFQAIDRFSLKSFPVQLGIYGAGLQIVNIITLITAPFTNFWISMAFKKYKESPSDTEFFKNNFRIIFITIFIISIGLILFKDLVIYILLGEKFQDAKRIIPFLLLSVIMYVIPEVTGIGILFKKRVVLNLFIIIIAGLFNFVGNYYLVPIYKGVGAAISTGLSYIIYCLLRTIFSALYYKVDYDFKQLAITTFLYIIYATYVTFYDNIYIDSILGVAFITYLIVLNRKFIIKNLKQIF